MAQTIERNLPPDLKLLSGKHTLPRNKQPKEGCVMEWASWLAGEPWSDRPECVSPAIGAFLRSWNDTLNDEDRQILAPFIPRVLGTATTPEAEERRAWMATDWLARTFAPAWLDLAGLKDHAQALRALPELTCDELADQSIEIIRAARSAAESAARSAAESAARSAARSAAESAAESAARSAARSAAWSAARSAAESAARSAAWSAARSAAWSAARSAATEALAPTVKLLQASALELLERMIAA